MVSNKAPTQSIGPLLRFSTLSLTWVMRIQAEAIENGSVMKKTQRQESLSQRKPPIVGPARLDAPQTALKSPWTLARSSSVKRSPSIVRTIGPSAPAPSPCTTRKAMSCCIDCAMPDKTDPSENIAKPNRRRRFRPQRSASLP